MFDRVPRLKSAFRRTATLPGGFDDSSRIRAWRYRLFWMLVGVATITINVPWVVRHEWLTDFVRAVGARGAGAWLVIGVGLLPVAPVKALAAWLVLRLSGLLPPRGEHGVPLSRVLRLIGFCIAFVALTIIADRLASPAQRSFDFSSARLEQVAFWISQAFHAALGAGLLFWAARERSELRQRVYWIAAGFSLFPILGGASGVARHVAAALVDSAQFDGVAAYLVSGLLGALAWCGGLALLLVPLGIALRTYTTRSPGLRLLGVVTLGALSVATPALSLWTGDWAAPEPRLEVVQVSSIVSMVLFCSFFVAAFVWSRRFGARDLQSGQGSTV